MNSVCFPIYFLADERVRTLTKPEKLDFALAFCPLAAKNRREPGIIPRMPVTTLARKLGLATKVTLKRLEKLSSPDSELITLEYDSPPCEDAVPGALNKLSTVRVEILDFAEWNGLDDIGDADEFSAPFDGPERRGQGNGLEGRRQNDAAGLGGIGQSVDARRQWRSRRRKTLRAEIAELDTMIQTTTNPAARAQLCANRESALAELTGLDSGASRPQQGTTRNGAELQQSVTGNEQSENQQSVTGNGESHAFGGKSHAQALQNGTASVTESRLDATQNGQNGVTQALRPSRAGVGNVQRIDSGLHFSTEEDNTLNVGSVTPVTPDVTATSSSAPTSRRNNRRPPLQNTKPLQNGRARRLAEDAIKICQELQDLGSEDGHYLLLAVAEEHGAEDVIRDALQSTRKRMANTKQPPLDRPGAYYQRAVRRQFADRQIFIPTKAEMEEQTPEEVRRLMRESLATADAVRASGGADNGSLKRSAVTPLENIYPEADDAPMPSSDGNYVP